MNVTSFKSDIMGVRLLQLPRSIKSIFLWYLHVSLGSDFGRAWLERQTWGWCLYQRTRDPESESDCVWQEHRLRVNLWVHGSGCSRYSARKQQVNTIRSFRNLSIRLYLYFQIVFHFIARLPGRGGVLTPGFAFANTSLIDRLNSHGVPFKVEVEDLKVEAKDLDE